MNEQSELRRTHRLSVEDNRPLLSGYDHGKITVVDLDAEFGGTEARQKLEKSLLRKLDLRMSILVLIYILNYIDRNNVAAARLRGFESDLHLSGQEFDTILSILQVGYIIMQVPSNMFLNSIGKPSLYLPCCMVAWGFISILTGMTTTFASALITRFLLGFVEAAFFPGALLLLSKWYKRCEIGQRTALLVCGSILSNAVGSLIASWILDVMEGKLGIPAWRWLFFVEGSITIAVAIYAGFVLPDFPNTPSVWLTVEERSLASMRLLADSGIHDESESQGKGSRTTGIGMALSDSKVWWLAVTLTSMTMSLSFNAFFPTLSETMGFSRTVTLLLCAPPWIVATLIALAVSRHSDKTGERCWHIIAPLSLGLLGFLIAASTMNTGARYISLFLIAQSYAGIVVMFAWISNSVSRPLAKRATALAFINAFSQLGNIAGSYIWPRRWGPTYTRSFFICMMASTLSILMCLAFRRHLASLNRIAYKLERSGGQKTGHRYWL